jgi:predicted nucleic acid-binding protein
VSFLVDTNAVSEWVKPVPDPGLVAFLDAVDEDRVYVSVITVAELRQGIERLAPGRRREQLEIWIQEQFPQRFAGRVLVVDESIADAWGRLVARTWSAGRPIGIMDGFIAATAQANDFTLVTRNVSDFEAAGITVLNPWTS